MALGEIGGRDAHLGRGSWREVGHEGIGAIEQPVQYVHSSGRLGVQRDRLFAAVAPHEVRGKTSGAVDHVVVVTREIPTVGVLHLDDPCAEVSEHTSAYRRGHGLLHGDDGDSRQRGGR
jgi:hypothetical protein